MPVADMGVLAATAWDTEDTAEVFSGMEVGSGVVRATSRTSGGGAIGSRNTMSTRRAMRARHDGVQVLLALLDERRNLPPRKSPNRIWLISVKRRLPRPLLLLPASGPLQQAGWISLSPSRWMMMTSMTSSQLPLRNNPRRNQHLRVSSPSPLRRPPLAQLRPRSSQPRSLFPLPRARI